MEPIQNFPNNLSMQELLRLAASPAGQQLIALLQKQAGSDFQNAMASAASGDYEPAKRAMEALMADPQAQKLLRQLGG